MGKLEEIEQQLYGKEKEVQESLERRTNRRAFFPRTRSHLPSIWVPEHPPMGGDAPWVRHPWRYFFGATFLVLIALSGVFVFFYLRAQGQEARVEIQASDITESGGTITIPIVYRNVSRTTLHDGEIAISLPPGAILRDQGSDIEAPSRIIKKIEALKPGDQGVVEITVRLFGQEHEDQTIGVIYYYRPENLRAQFSARADKIVRIVKVPLALSWEIPETLSRGQDVTIKIHYTLDNSLPFNNISLKMEYPSGFTFTSADPKPAVGSNIWHIGTLEPGQEGVITVRGTMAGEEGEIKAFHSSLGVFNVLTKEWKTFSESSEDIMIAVTPLSVQGFLGQAREGIIKPGAKLKFMVKYRNNTTSILQNVTVKALLQGSILNQLTLIPENDGVVDAKTGAAVWGPGNVHGLRRLAPDQSGELTLTITAKDPPPVISEKDKNLTISMQSSIDAASIPDELKGTNLSSVDRIEFKVASKVLFSGKALYGESPIPNTGPFPPQVGMKTTYSILWEIKNFTNNISNAKITTTLPPNITWESTTRADGTAITYDTASSRVTWEIGVVPAGTGVLTPTRVGAFLVSVTPAEIDRQTVMKLINGSEFIGTDSFTSELVNFSIGHMTTAVESSLEGNAGGGVVR